MKKYLYYVICILSVLTVFFAGCKDKNAPESFNGNVARPTWTAPGVSDITSSMTAVIKVDLKAQYPETAADWQPSVNDLLAAFSGETCLGVAQPQDGLFFLYIAAPVTGNPSSVTLRYYCAHYKNLFEAKDAFRFINDDHLGTIAEPFTLTKHRDWIMLTDSPTGIVNVQPILEAIWLFLLGSCRCLANAAFFFVHFVGI